MIDDIVGHYRDLLRKHGDTHDAAQYSSRESQEARYRVLAKIGSLEGQRILDFGSGTGHFATFLKNAGINFSYVGVDIVPEYFPIARQKHPEHRFGFLSDFQAERFDYSFVSGVFNNRMADNDGFWRRTVADLYSRSDRGLAFNMMSAYVDFESPHLFYVRPEEVFAFAKTLTPYVTLHNDYLVKQNSVPFEFATFLHREPRVG